MYTAAKNIYRERVDFPKINTSIPIPNLIEIQKNSYERFLQMRVLPGEREDAGLQSVFKSVFPITDLRENCSLEFVEYSIGNWECKCGRLVGLDKLGRPCTFCAATIIMDPRGDREIHCPKCGHLNENNPVTCDTCDEPVGLKLKYDVDECQERGMTFAVPLKVTIRLVVWDKDPETGAKTIRDIKEQEVYFGDIPLMTENGTFIINGTERVIVSQLHRSPGVFFSQPEKGLFAAQIIPYRGSWVEFEYDSKNLLHVRIDRKRKFLATVFLRALGIKTDAEILKTFYKWDRIQVREGKLFWKFSENLQGLKLSKTHLRGQGRAPAGARSCCTRARRSPPASSSSCKAAEVEEIEVTEADLEGAFTVSDIVDPRTGEVILEANEALNPRVLSVVLDPESQVGAFEVFFPERDDIGPMMSATVKKDTIKTPGRGADRDLPAHAPGRSADPRLLAQPVRGHVPEPAEVRLLAGGPPEAQHQARPVAARSPTRSCTRRTSPPSSAFLLKLRRNPQDVDDIDHLGNRRVRCVGELLENQFRIGLVRMERAIKEKMSVYQEMATAMPHDLINAKPVMASIREFFGSQPAQPVHGPDQPALARSRTSGGSRPLGRAASAASAPGSRCATSTRRTTAASARSRRRKARTSASSRRLSCFARINEFGFIESPYRKVKNGAGARLLPGARGRRHRATRSATSSSATRSSASRTRSRPQEEGPAEVEPYCFYLSAWEEDKYTIAQANIKLDDDGDIVEDRVSARKMENFVLAKREEIDYIDVSPKQLVSVAASLVPFLENDDANRALMGSNMQRQAVPLLRSEAPLVGTGHGAHHGEGLRGGGGLPPRRRRGLRGLAAASSSASRPRTAPTRARRSAPTSTT